MTIREWADRRRQIFTPHTRSLIHRAIKRDPATGWKGSRRGVKMQISLFSQAELGDERVVWRARINKSWQGGRNSSIREAIDEIETRAARLSLAPVPLVSKPKEADSSHEQSDRIL